MIAADGTWSGQVTRAARTMRAAPRSREQASTDSEPSQPPARLDPLHASSRTQLAEDRQRLPTVAFGLLGNDPAQRDAQLPQVFRLLAAHA